MFEAPLLQDQIWSNLIKFNITTLVSRLWVPWMLIVAIILGCFIWLLRHQIRTSPAYFNLFHNTIYTFRPHKKRDWAALFMLLAALASTLFYMYNTENSFFENFDLMALGTTRSLVSGVVPNFDYARITPLAFWNLSSLYAITQNMYVIKGFVFAQLLLAIWLMYCFFDYIPAARRLIFLAVFILTPTMLLTSKIVFPDREIIIALMAALLCAKKYSQTSKLRWVAWFLFFMNVAIYTKETCILFFFGILITSVLYNIWNEKITLRSFLHPWQLIKEMPLEFLIALCLLMYSVIYFVLQTPNESNIYLNNGRHQWQSLLNYYQFELAVCIAAVCVLLLRAKRYYDTLINPMFRGGLVIGSLVIAFGIVFVLQTAPNSPHLVGKTYYLLLTLLFALAYIFEHIRSRLVLAVLSVAILFYSAVKNIEASKQEIGVYYRETAEFLAQNMNKNDINFLFIIEKPQATHDIDQWIIEAWSTIYRYYFKDYKLIIKSNQHLIKTVSDLVHLQQFRLQIYTPIVPIEKPTKGDWVIINKNNYRPETLEIRKNIPQKPVFENKLFEVFRL